MDKIYLSILILIIGTFIILSYSYFETRSKRTNNGIFQVGGGDYRVTPIVKNQPTLQFNYLRNKFDTKQKTFTLLIRINFLEEPKPGDFLFKCSKETLLDQQTLKAVESGYGPSLTVTSQGDSASGLSVQFGNKTAPILWKPSEIITNNPYYLILVVDNGRYRLFDGNSIPKEGYVAFELGSDLIVGPHLIVSQDGLVTTSRKVPTGSSVISLFYLPEILSTDYIRDNFGILKEVMEGERIFITEKDRQQVDNRQIDSFTNKDGPQKAGLVVPDPIPSTGDVVAVINDEESEEVEVGVGVEAGVEAVENGDEVGEIGVKVPKRPTQLVELSPKRKKFISSTLAKDMQILVPHHNCYHSLKRPQLLPPKTRFTLAVLLKINDWPLEQNYRYSLISGDERESVTPCIELNVSNPGIVVRSSGGSAENVCQFNHNILKGEYYFYIIIYNYNRVSIVYNEQAVKYCTNYMQEPFERPNNLYLGPNKMSSSQGCANILTLGYFPIALNEKKAIRNYHAVKERLIAVQRNGILKPKAKAKLDTKGSDAKRSDTMSQKSRSEIPIKQTSNRVTFSLPPEIANSQGVEKKNQFGVHRENLFKEFEADDYDYGMKVPENDKYFRAE